MRKFGPLSQTPVGAEYDSQNCLSKDASGASWALQSEASGSVGLGWGSGDRFSRSVNERIL